MQRYFIQSEQINGNLIVIVDQDYHHIKNVMRMRIAEKVEVCDENQNLFLCVIKEINKNNVVLETLEKLKSDVELPTSITIALGLTRGSKLEEVLRRITELGADGFIPVEMKRSVVRIKDEKNSKLERMNTIVKEASEQSKRTKLLSVANPLKLDKLLDNLDQFDILVYAYEDLKTNSLNKFKNIIPLFKGKRVLIIVGPEGGFDPLEVELLNNKGFIPIGLGPRILRLETAPLYIMSAISYELEL
ncbi:MAG: 16S rRNA (uracil(1498)-N(3))-methyltransferase [Bacilli bacterium]